MERTKCYKLLKIAILLYLSVIGYLLIFRSEEKRKIEISPELPNEIGKILLQTPYLWRNFSLDKNVSSRSRIQAQQKWVERLSRTKYLMEAYPDKKKIMWLDDDVGKFYWTGGQVMCPYAPQFEEKCVLKQLPNRQKLFGPWRYVGVVGDAVISTKTAEFKPRVPLPAGMRQILSILEPPSHVRGAIEDLSVNSALLASYWKGSDIPIPYYLFLPEKNLRKIGKDFIVAKIRSKTKLAAAMISSNCGLPPFSNSDGMRLEYIQELRKYVEVDVFGKCGELECPKSEREPCLRKIEAEYKFFLAFENSRCEDYITEKFFGNALEYYTVPVVRGGRPSDYLTAAPNNSYIHLDDFNSPQELAEYLKYLDKNEEAYLRYFDWKGSGEISKEHFQDFFCRACAMLFYADFVPPPVWKGSDIRWKDVNTCLNSEASRW